MSRSHEPSPRGPAPPLTSLGSLDAVLPAALEGDADQVLAALCQELAGLATADVVTIYVGGPGDDLVVAANVGLSSDVVGNLRLRMGEGAVGHAAVSGRPIALASGVPDPHFKAIRGIGEEHFPVLLALPLIHRGATLGALVFQRRTDDFDAATMRLAGVLASTAALVVAATLVATAGARDPEAVSACLRGTSLSPGSGLGRVDLMATVEALSRAPQVSADRLAGAFARLDRELLRLRHELPASEVAASVAIARLELLVADARLRDHILSGGDRSIASLARDYARAPFRLAERTGDLDEDLVGRARDVEELCVVLHGLATGRLLQSGRVWIGERLGAFLAVAAAPRASAVILDGDSHATADGIAIARAAGVPVIGAVAGLFSWSRPGDLVAVDAERGEVRINPSATRVMRARAATSAR